MALGDILRRARTRQGLTQRALAKRMNITHSSISQWEAGITRPSILNRVDLAAILDVPFADLVPEAIEAGQVTVTDPQSIALLQAFSQIPSEQREYLLMMVAAHAEKVTQTKG